MHPHSASKKGEQLEVTKEISWPFRNSKLHWIKYSLSEVTCGLVECNYLKIISVKQVVCNRASAGSAVVLSLCWSISLHPEIRQFIILPVGASDALHTPAPERSPIYSPIVRFKVIKAKVLGLMGWKCFLGDEAFTRQVFWVIRCAGNNGAPSRDHPQVFRCWTLVSQSPTAGSVKNWSLSKMNSSLNILQKCPFLEVISISSLHFSKLPQEEGAVLFHLIYVSDKT